MFKDKIRKIDIEDIVKFIIVSPIAWILKKKKKNIWLVSERPSEARDNGYYFFSYVIKEKKSLNTYYVVKFDSKDYEKIKELGNIIKFGSMKHYLYYLITDIHISAHIDGGMPNRRVCNFLERKGILRNKKVFLQHGVTKDRIEFAFYKNTRVDMFICAAKPEYNFVKDNFGYPIEHVKLLGFCRFDGLYDNNLKRQIVLMPTWRAWLTKKAFESNDEVRKRFVDSEYFKRYFELINNTQLIELLQKYNLQLVFYPHSDMQEYIDLFECNNENIIIGSSNDYDVQELLKESKVLITDYSSVAFDFAYMDKPIVYYQFDHDKFRKLQHAEGYYKYTRDSFGPIFEDTLGLINELDNMIKREFELESKYEKRIKEFFELKDKCNCDRTYEYIKRL